MSYSDEKDKVINTINKLHQLILDHTEIRFKGIVIHINSLNLSDEQLFEESSRTLIARKIYRYLMEDKTLCAPQEYIIKVVPLIRRAAIAWITEAEICRIFKIPVETLWLNRNFGLFILEDEEFGNLYDWDQALLFFDEP